MGKITWQLTLETTDFWVYFSSLHLKEDKSLIMRMTGSITFI